MPRERTENRSYIPRQIKNCVLIDNNYICAHCGKLLKYPVKYTLEHVIPLKKGGTNDIENFVALCETCNQKKSDDIVDPKTYYTYLSKDKLAKIQKVFDNYIKNTRWLANDNLFKTDQFEVNALTAIFKPGSQKPIIRKVPLNITKMRKNEIVNWFLMYGGRLNPRDKYLLTYDEKSIQTPYYAIKQNNNIIAIISVYIEKSNQKTIMCPDNHLRNVLFIDIFTHPDNKNNRTSVEIIASLMTSIVHEIQNTLIHHARGTTIELMFRSPASDQLTGQAMDLLHQIHKNQFANLLMIDGNDAEICGNINCLNAILFQGNRNDSEKLSEKYNNTLSEDSINLNINNLQKPIDDELTLSKEINRNNTKITKSDKKRQKKKKHNKK